MLEIFADVYELLKQGETLKAKAMLDNMRQAGIIPEKNMWEFHELYGAIFYGLADAEGVACAYLNAAKADTILRSQREHYSNYLFALHYLAGISPADVAREHFKYQQLYREENFLPPPAIKNHAKLRVGFLANAFLDSSSARFYECLLKNLASYAIDVFVYSLTNDQDDFTCELQASPLTYKALANKSILESVSLIRNDELDILIDLDGHSNGGMTLMLMAEKIAPLELMGIGYFATTGLTAIDGFITDSELSPTGDEKYFSEALIRLPTAFCFTPTIKMQNIARKRSTSAPIVFGVWQNYLKITSEAIKLWQEILAKIPDSILIVRDTTRLESRRTAIKEKFIQAGADLSRIKFILGSDDYLQDYNEIDIMLDTFPYTGGAMTATALYMGVPVVTLRGKCHGERLSAAIIAAAGYREWIAASPDEYIDIAVNLAINKDLLQLQQNLRAEMIDSRLMDSKAYVANFAAMLHNLKKQKGINL